MHGLPLAYNKDMQEDKEQLFDAVDTLNLCLQPRGESCRPRTFRRERLAAAAGDEFLALPTSRTCSCAAAWRSGSRMRWSRGSCATRIEGGKRCRS